MNKEMTFNGVKFRFGWLKLTAVIVASLLALFALISNALAMASYGGWEPKMQAATCFAMFGEFVMAFAIGLIIWKIATVLERKSEQKDAIKLPAANKPAAEPKAETEKK